jgi:hypothetical protein
MIMATIAARPSAVLDHAKAGRSGGKVLTKPSPSPATASICLVRSLQQLRSLDVAKLTQINFGLVVDLRSLLRAGNPLPAIAELLSISARLAEYLKAHQRMHDFVTVVGGAIDGLSEGNIRALRQNGVSVIRGEVDDDLVADYTRRFESGRKYIRRSNRNKH